jgi:hypothetical protein
LADEGADRSQIGLRLQRPEDLAHDKNCFLISSRASMARCFSVISMFRILPSSIRPVRARRQPNIVRLTCGSHRTRSGPMAAGKEKGRRLVRITAPEAGPAGPRYVPIDNTSMASPQSVNP